MPDCLEIRWKTALQEVGISGSLALLIGSDLSAKAFTLASFSLIARTLGAESYGLLAWAQAFVSYGTLAELGLTPFGARSVAAEPEQLKAWVRGILRLRCLLSTSAVALLLAIAMWTSHPARTPVVALAATWLLASMLNLEWVIQGLGRPDWVGLSRLLAAVGLFGSTLIWRASSQELLTAASLRTLAEMAAVILLAWMVYHLWPANAATAVPALPVRRLAAQAAPFMGASLCTFFYAANLDLVWLAVFRPPAVVGCYAAAFRLYLVCAMLPKLLLVAFYPAFARQESTGEVLATHWRRFLSVSLLFSIPVAVLTGAVAPEVIETVYGAAFRGGAAPLRILAIGGAASVLNSGLVALLMARGLARQGLICSAGGMAVNLAVNLAGIARFGEIASASAVASAELVVLFLAAWQVRHRFGLELWGSAATQASAAPALATLAACCGMRMWAGLHDMEAAPRLLAIAGVGAAAWLLALLVLMRFSRRNRYEGWTSAAYGAEYRSEQN